MFLNIMYDLMILPIDMPQYPIPTYGCTDGKINATINILIICGITATAPPLINATAYCPI